MDRAEKQTNAGLGSQLTRVWRLSVPAILTQITSIVMQYIDSAMVGRLGPGASAAIGLVSSSTWLMSGFIYGVSAGFSVQVAHQIGAGEEAEARRVVKHGIVAGLILSTLLMCIGALISGPLPRWLGGERDLWKDASAYFMVFALTFPFMQMNSLASCCLQCSGNMVTPSVLNAIMCALDVVFNAIFIPRFGVLGAGIGTGLATAVISLAMLWCCCIRSEALRLTRREPCPLDREILRRAVKIGTPVAGQELAMCGAMVASTRIIAPLGTAAIAANSFAVTAESLCYMPGYGIGTAATTLIGQSIGAGRKDMTRRLGWLTTGLGMAVMAGSGVLLYAFAPYMIGILSPDEAIRALGTKVLRIEAFAEPMYAASIVASGVFRGAGDTLIPSCMNFFSMWAVRIPLGAFLAPRFGLEGVWVAMCLELCVRGILFLFRLAGKRWYQGAEGKRKGA